MDTGECECFDNGQWLVSDAGEFIVYDGSLSN